METAIKNTMAPAARNSIDLIANSLRRIMTTATPTAHGSRRPRANLRDCLHNEEKKVLLARNSRQQSEKVSVLING
jgi:hypothetical protein